LIVGDFNGDGKPDLAVAGGALSIMLGNGDGSFQPSENFGVGIGGAGGLAVADFDRNGKVDVVTTDPASDKVTVLTNITP
jgi:hypothetical protein